MAARWGDPVSTPPDTPKRLPLPHMLVESRGNGNAPHQDSRLDEVDGRAPRTPLQIAVDSALEAKRAAEEAAEHAGNAFREASAARVASESCLAGQGALRADFERLATDVKSIAKAVGAKRTYSGGFAAVSQPSPPAPLTLSLGRSDTGQHKTISESELELLTERWADINRRLTEAEQRAHDAEVEERGAREFAEKLELEAKKAAEAAKEKRDRAADIRSRIGTAIAIAVPLSALLATLYQHFH